MSWRNALPVLSVTPRRVRWPPLAPRPMLVRLSPAHAAWCGDPGGTTIVAVTLGSGWSGQATGRELRAGRRHRESSPAATPGPHALGCRRDPGALHRPAPHAGAGRLSPRLGAAGRRPRGGLAGGPRVFWGRVLCQAHAVQASPWLVPPFQSQVQPFGERQSFTAGSRCVASPAEAGSPAQAPPPLSFGTLLLRLPPSGPGSEFTVCVTFLSRCPCLRPGFSHTRLPVPWSCLCPALCQSRSLHPYAQLRTFGLRTP